MATFVQRMESDVTIEPEPESAAAAGEPIPADELDRIRQTIARLRRDQRRTDARDHHD